MKADLVVFGEDWGRHPSSTQHIVARLAQRRRVLWVNSIGMRRPRLDRRDFARAARKLVQAAPKRASGSVSSECRVPDGITLASPLVVPWPGSRVAEQVNARLLRRQIGAALERSSIVGPILWTSLPSALPAVGMLGEQAVVYYCGDDFGALAGVDHDAVLEMECRLVARADLVIAASEVLAARFPSHKTVHIPHGADIDLFSHPAPCPPDLGRDRPTAGFYGSVADWVDTELLEGLARALPQWDFVLVGSISTPVERLKSLPNVRFLGPRPHAELPGYAQHWSASILPFRDCPQIRACNPLKLREYLAAGRPVVSTAFPAVMPYRDHVSIAEGVEQFRAALLSSLSTSSETVGARQRCVASETWEARAADVDRLLDDLTSGSGVRQRKRIA